jgi:uncharacterized OsmC-like protein
MASEAAVRRYGVRAQSTNTFGRVLCSVRDHHFVADGPVHNGCPGEEVTPAELFLAGVASCGVELLQVFARETDVSLRAIDVTIGGEIDYGRPVRSDLNLFNSVHLEFRLEGATADQGAELVERFKRR